jgi:hypothetical protein
MTLSNASAAGESNAEPTALNNPSADEGRLAPGEGTRAGRRGEHDQAGQERPPRSDQVGKSTTGDEKSAERKRVSGDDPLQAVGGGSEGRSDHW